MIRADERTLTPYAGLAVVGELVRRLGLLELIDGALARERRAQPLKRRRRGLSGGGLLLALAESQLVGATCFDDLEQLRADGAGAPLRAVAETAAASTARQFARRFRRVHLQALERALARAGELLDHVLCREPAAPVTIDLDATEVEVYGRRKRGARRSPSGALAYQAYVAFWAERGRALASELEPGNRTRLSASAGARLCRRAFRLLPAGHGPVSFRLDSAFYQLELLKELRRLGAHFSVSVPRREPIWAALARIPAAAWQPANEMPGAEVAEASYAPWGWKQAPLRLLVRRLPFSADELSTDPRARRLRTIPAAQLALALEGELDTVYGYSFILTDRAGTAVELEHFHRSRAQIEERLREAKLGQALRRLPSADQNGNRVWLAASLLALNLSAFCCDLCPLAAASGQAPAGSPLRRAAKTLRRLLFCVPARVTRSARRTVLRLPAGFRFADAFRQTYEAAYGLRPP